jgi:hypothetical protein
MRHAQTVTDCCFHFPSTHVGVQSFHLASPVAYAVASPQAVHWREESIALASAQKSTYDVGFDPTFFEQLRAIVTGVADALDWEIDSPVVNPAKTTRTVTMESGMNRRTRPL